MRGWRGEPRRHSLAAHGIGSRPTTLVAGGMIGDRVKFPGSRVDYSDAEEVFVAFWVASLSNDFLKFDFERAFTNLEEQLDAELRHLGMLSNDDYRQYVENRGYDVEEYFQEAYPSDYRFYNSELGLGGEELEDALLTEGRARLEQNEPYRSWVSTRENLKKRRQAASAPEKIALMDAIIDLEHERGSAFTNWDEGDYIDVEKLRAKVEAIYRRYGHV